MKRIGMGILILWSLFLGAVLASCMPGADRPAEPKLLPTAILSDLLRQDAEAMAEELGISVEEAVQRLTLQDWIGTLNAELEQREADTFAGLWIEQEPEYQVIVAFTRNGRSTIKQYIEATPLETLIKVRSARATLAELVAAEQRANQLVQALGFASTTAVDVKENRAVVWVADRAQLEVALKNAGLELPEYVEVIVPGESPQE